MSILVDVVSYILMFLALPGLVLLSVEIILLERCGIRDFWKRFAISLITIVITISFVCYAQFKVPSWFIVYKDKTTGQVEEVPATKILAMPYEVKPGDLPASYKCKVWPALWWRKVVVYGVDSNGTSTNGSVELKLSSTGFMEKESEPVYTVEQLNAPQELDGIKVLSIPVGTKKIKARKEW
jgi:hypothetical protein